MIHYSLDSTLRWQLYAADKLFLANNPQINLPAIGKNPIETAQQLANNARYRKIAARVQAYEASDSYLQDIKSRQPKKTESTMIDNHKQCEWCKSEFITDRKQKRFCSDKCRNAAKSKRHRITAI